MKIRKAQTVWLLDYLEMIPMILWQSVVQNGYIPSNNRELHPWSWIDRKSSEIHSVFM